MGQVTLSSKTVLKEEKQKTASSLSFLCKYFISIINLNRNPAPFKVPSEIAHELDLLFEREARDDELEDVPDGDVVLLDKAAVVHVREDTHQESVRKKQPFNAMSVGVLRGWSIWLVRTGNPSDPSFLHAPGYYAQNP